MTVSLCTSFRLYMAPEILRYEKYDAKADLWSVGAVLYETAVGKPPFRAQNHIELLKKIEHSKGIKFPDDDPAYQEKEPDHTPVPSDVKKLIRSLLKRFPAERASFDDFFGSTALARSKFPRPNASESADATSPRTVSQAPSTGEQELVVVGTMRKKPPPLALPELPSPEPDQAVRSADESDPKPAIVPTKFNFRRRESGYEGTTPGVEDADFGAQNPRRRR